MAQTASPPSSMGGPGGGSGEPPLALGEFMTGRQKFLLMNSLMLCMFVSALDQSIIATAMPKILADLGGFKLLSWVFTTYLLSSTVVVPVVGKLSDMFGRKPFLLAGIALFVGASAAAGAAPSMLFLIGARTVQGVGGGIIFSCVFATMGDLFTPIQRAKYMGYFISSFTIASLIGPAVGGFLTDGPGWRWCFYINLPVGAIAMIFIWFNLPATKTGGRLSDVDFAGAALLGVATTALMLALVWAGERFGWGAPETVGLFGVAGALILAFLWQESRHPNAILPLALFRNRTFVYGCLIVSCMGTGLFGAVQFLPTFLQTALGSSATASGLISTPQAVGLLVSSIIGGQIVARTGRFKYTVLVGASLTAISAFLLTTMDEHTIPWHISVYMVISGLGGGMIGPLMSVVIQNSVSHEFMGVATSSRQFFMQISQVIGVAVFGVIFTTSYSTTFTDETARVREAIPAVAYAEFQDPTLALDPARYAAVRATVLALPDGRGESLLSEALGAQKDAVTVGIRRLFFVSLGIGVVMMFLAATIREVPIRSTFRPSAEEMVGGA